MRIGKISRIILAFGGSLEQQRVNSFVLSHQLWRCISMKAMVRRLLFGHFCHTKASFGWAIDCGVVRLTYFLSHATVSNLTVTAI